MLILDFSEDWRSLEDGQTRKQFEQEVLPAYLSRQRWFASKGTEITRAELLSRFVLPGRGGRWLLAIFRAHLGTGRAEDYFVPLAAVWGPRSCAESAVDLDDVIAGIRKGGQSGTLRDALGDPRFVADLLRAAGDKLTLTDDGGELRFTHTHSWFPLREQDELAARKLGAEQSNSSIVIAKKMVLKAYRRLERGIQPELEVGRYLTDMAGYQNAPPLLASIEQFDSDQPTALAVVHGFVPNQGDGWAFTLAHLKRLFSSILQGGVGEHANQSYAALATRLGIRVAELHRAFATETGDAAFQPEPITATDVSNWKRQIQFEAETTFGLLGSAEGMLPPEQHARVQTLLESRSKMLNLISRFELVSGSTLTKTRFHGDLHLGQVLVAGEDFYIIDFEGEPARPFAQRRAKHSPLRDVAGMLRSLNYAAWSALLDASAGDPVKIGSLEEHALNWERESSHSFMEGYQQTVEGCSSCPADPETFTRLLHLFILEKALYEVRYELANRPSWLRIPVEGIMSLLANG